MYTVQIYEISLEEPQRKRCFYTPSQCFRNTVYLFNYGLSHNTIWSCKHWVANLHTSLLGHICRWQIKGSIRWILLIEVIPIFACLLTDFKPLFLLTEVNIFIDLCNASCESKSFQQQSLNSLFCFHGQISYISLYKIAVMDCLKDMC